MLCRGGAYGAYGATMNATWQDPSLTGVFIRLLWSAARAQLPTRSNLSSRGVQNRTSTDIME